MLSETFLSYCESAYNNSAYEALPGGAPMSLVWILKCLVSVFINASRRCRKLNENSLSLSEF